MKKIITYIGIFSMIISFSQCVPEKSTPDASYKYYLSSDSTKAENPASIFTTDQVIFESMQNLDKNVYYTVFTGNTKDNTYLRTDTIQSNFGVGIELVKGDDGIYRTNKIQFQIPGSYKIYMIATTVDLNKGKTARVIDSSKTIIVTDPDAKKALITAFPITRAGNKIHGNTATQEQMKGLPLTPIVTNDSIIFSDINPIYKGYFLACIFSPVATSNNIMINDTVMSVNTKAGNYIYDGSKVKITANEGGESKIYSVAIRYYVAPKSADSTIKSATVKQVGSDFAFTGTATIAGNIITIPSWPKGTTQCELTVKITGVADKVYTIGKVDFPITATAQNGTSKMNYTVKAPATEISASVTNPELTNKTGSIIIKSVGNNYEIIAEKAADLTAAKLGFTIGTFTKIQFTSNNDFSTGLALFTSGTTVLDFSASDTYYFVATCGTDVKQFSVKMTAF